jgi:antitoxin (DNA-binding transcriptional repressor) of toxin-antitoxin stability system
MKTLTISEATSNLALWLQQAVAGEEIGIRTGNTLVVLRPLPAAANEQEPERLSPREALRRLQQDARLTPAQAESYLNEVRAERLAVEDRGAA